MLFPPRLPLKWPLLVSLPCAPCEACDETYVGLLLHLGPGPLPSLYGDTIGCYYLFIYISCNLHYCILYHCGLLHSLEIHLFLYLFCTSTLYSARAGYISLAIQG